MLWILYRNKVSYMASMCVLWSFILTIFVSYDLRFLFLWVLVLFRLLHSGVLSEDADKNMFVKDKHCKANDEHCKANEHPVCFVGDENLKAYATGYRIGYKVGYQVGWQGGDVAYLGARQENDNMDTTIHRKYYMAGYQVGHEEGLHRGHAGYQERMIKQISKNDNDDKNDDKKKEDEAFPVQKDKNDDNTKDDAARNAAALGPKDA